MESEFKQADTTNQIVFVGGTAILPERQIDNATIACEDGTITFVGQQMDDPVNAQVVDCTGKIVSPGFIDIHVHGGDGADFMDGSTAAVRIAKAAHTRHGTTTIFPTTTTGNADQILAMLSACQQVASERSGSHLAGVHLYGPYFAEDKVGCHRPAGRRSPEVSEFSKYFETGIVRIATCAAELTGSDAFYETAAGQNCLITCGHSNSSWTEMQAAFDRGMRHVDHFWCAMSSVPSLRGRFGVPMQASMAEFVLMNRAMSTEVIADGQHLSAELLEFAYQMLSPNRLCLVTDCNRALDQPPGEYAFGDQRDNNRFYSDGRVGWTIDRASLASGVVGMDSMVRHMKQSTTASLPEVIRMASLTPAERTGIADHTGSISVGKRADLLILNQDLTIEHVFAAGRLVV